MEFIRPKKHLGQHFLIDQNIAQKIIDAQTEKDIPLLEIGPGTGVLTAFLSERKNFHMVDIDKESIDHLNSRFPALHENIYHQDFLKSDLLSSLGQRIALIGNLPYNISSPILIKVIENQSFIEEAVFMIQKEVAERIASPPGNKRYGIVSVQLQAFFKVELLFSVSEKCFNPPPNVKSAVVRLTNLNTELGCDFELFRKIIRTSFNTRRKTIRNGLKSFSLSKEITNHDVFNQRPEQLSVHEFIDLTNLIEKST